ncbi:MAG: DUF4416 family protein [Candidatus Omnitrophota bacterium]
MGISRIPPGAKLIVGILAKDLAILGKAEELLNKEFGEIGYKSALLQFNFTDYYKEEMGNPLLKRFLCFKKLVSLENMPKIKIKTNDIEKKLALDKDGLLKRQVNIDPGYITDSKLVLLTTKDFSHRIYLNKGIYAEITLAWKKNSFVPMEWTYPDYRSKEYIDILNLMREMYMKDREA